MEASNGGSRRIVPFVKKNNQENKDSVKVMRRRQRNVPFEIIQEVNEDANSSMQNTTWLQQATKGRN